MNPKPTTIDHEELLERKANIARRRLMNTVDELDARKNEVEREVKTVAKTTSILPYAAGAVGSLWLMVGLGGIGRRIRRWNKRRARRAQWRRLLRAVRLA